MALKVKNSPANAGDTSTCQRFTFDPWVRKIPLKEEMATHSSILAWKIPWTEETAGLQFMGPQRVRHDWATERIYTSRIKKIQ